MVWFGRVDSDVWFGSTMIGPGSDKEIIMNSLQDPETNGLKRLLAVKKSLSEFEQRVEHVRKVNRN